jgi:hypothetical protein
MEKNPHKRLKKLDYLIDTLNKNEIFQMRDHFMKERKLLQKEIDANSDKFYNSTLDTFI